MTELGKLAVWPAFDADFEEAALEVLRSGRVNYWTGPHGKAFEQEYAQFVGAKHAVALANGTVALELPLEAWGVTRGDEVIVTPRTFIASASAVVRLGAIPIFADVDRDSGNITAETVERVLSPRTKGIIAVHLAGWPIEMDAMNALAREKGLFVLEDCAQSHGATYRGQQTGALADAAAISFCQDKIMTTLGEGGMFTTDDESLWNKVWSLKDHGKDYSLVFHKQHPPGFRWLHDSFGSNQRMTEIQSSAGRVALKKLPGWVAVRQRLAARYIDHFQSVPGLRIPTAPAHVTHAYYRFYAYVEPTQLKAGWSRDRILAALNELGVPLLAGTCSEIYLEQAFQKAGLAPSQRLKVAQELGETSLQLPMHPLVLETQVDEICQRIAQVMAAAT